MNKTIKFLTTLLLLAVSVGAWADPITVTSTSFSKTYGSVGSDENVTFTSYQGGGTSAPAVYSNAIRLYQNSSGSTGGYVVIDVPEGYVITSATIQSTNSTTTGYILTDTNPGATTPAKSTFNVNDHSLSANTDYTVSGISTRYITFGCFGKSSSTRLNISKISVTYQAISGSQTETVATPVFSPAAGTYTSAQDVTISTETDGATIYFTTDGNDPTTNSSVYSSAINVSSTTTIKAMAVKEGMDNSAVAEATYKINTQNQTTITAGSLTHVTINELWDGDFNSITLGDNVSEGTLVYFTFNIDNGYTLESVTVKDANDNEVSITENTGSWSFTMPNTSVTINATATLETVKTLQSIAITTPPSKVVYEVGENFNPAGMVVTATYDDNTTAAITGYTFTPNTALTTDITEVTISYTENNVTKTATQTITVNEVVDYVTLPFSWAGGASSTLTALNGVSAHGLGSDYNSSHNPYNVKFDNDGDYILIKTNAQPGKVTIGVKMIGGASTSSIKVQGSSNGTDFTDVETLSISGNQNSVLTLETTNSFASSVRYVRLYFKKGSNVGVGPISILLPAVQQTLTIVANNGSVEITGQTLENGICQISQGSSVTATATADTHYNFSSWTAEGVELTNTTANPLTFTMPTNAVTLTANFTEKDKHNATFFANGEQVGTQNNVYEGDAITFPTVEASMGYTHVGWTTASIAGTQATAPETLVTAATMETQDVTYYAVFAIQTEGTPVENKSQTLQYDTWTYGGETTDKSTYRLFGENSYIESEAFDLSKLSKVIVYGGTFGGSNNNSLTIGTTTATWKSGTVSGNSQTGTNTFTGGTALSGTGKLRVISNSGDGSNSGLRISKVEIYTLNPTFTNTNFCTTIPVPTISIADIELGCEAQDGTVALSYENFDISEIEDFDIQYYEDAEGNVGRDKPEWIINVEVREPDGNYVVYYNIAANEGEARTAYFKVIAGGYVWSNLVTITQAAATVPVSISSAGMATFCSDKALDFTAVDAIHAYYVNVDNSGNLTFTRIRKIPANTGVLLRNAQGEDQGAVAAINVPVLSGEAGSVEGNAFVAVLEEIAQLASNAEGFNNYILNKKDGRLGFYHANNQKVGAGKAYLRIDDSIQARYFFGFNEGEATGIENVNHETTTNGRCYNLNGQQVSANYKGIVIVNGKKTIVK